MQTQVLLCAEVLTGTSDWIHTWSGFVVERIFCRMEVESLERG